MPRGEIALAATYRGRGRAPREIASGTPNLFYHNAEPEDPGGLAQSVEHELGFLHEYLRRAINTTRVDRYGMGWEQDLRFRYVLSPVERLRIAKPAMHILLRIDASTFDPEKPIMKASEERLLKIQKTNLHPRGIVLVLPPTEQVSPRETLYYGTRPTEWEVLTGTLAGHPGVLIDEKGLQHRILRWQEHSDHVLADVEPRVAPGSTLHIGDDPVEYRVVPMGSLAHVRLTDSDGDLPFTPRDGRGFVIEAFRRIKPPLRDDSEREFDCREDARGPNRGTWISIGEAEEETASPDEEQGGRLDLFFELLLASPKMEVWEKPDLSGRPSDRDGKIRVWIVDREDQRLLVEREPQVKTIYPPRNSYALSKQKQAVWSLMNFPSPAHRGLLRLFEEYDPAGWDTPRGDSKIPTSIGSSCLT